MLEILGLIGAFFTAIVGIATQLTSLKVGGLTDASQDCIEDYPDTDGRLEKRVEKKYGKVYKGYKTKE